MKRIFLLLSLPRSGTTMFCEMLESHPMVSCPHEPFADHEKRKNWREYLESLPGPVVVGHAHYNQLYSSMLTEEVPRILLEREKYQKGAVAELLIVGQRPHGQYTLPPHYVTAISDERRLRTTILRRFADLTITYEQLTGDEHIDELSPENARLICGFLGVPVEPLRTTSTKRGHHPRNAQALYA